MVEKNPLSEEKGTAIDNITKKLSEKADPDYILPMGLLANVVVTTVFKFRNKPDAEILEQIKHIPAYQFSKLYTKLTDEDLNSLLSMAKLELFPPPHH